MFFWSAYTIQFSHLSSNKSLIILNHLRLHERISTELWGKCEKTNPPLLMLFTLCSWDWEIPTLQQDLLNSSSLAKGNTAFEERNTVEHHAPLASEDVLNKAKPCLRF